MNEQKQSLKDQGEYATTGSNIRTLGVQPFQEQHHPVQYWARLWGFSPKTVREWFRNESGLGILRQHNSGRRSKRDYITLMISASAAARVYSKRTRRELIH